MNRFGKVSVRVEDHFGGTSELQFDSHEEVLMYISSQITKLQEGSISSLLILRQIPRKSHNEIVLKNQIQQEMTSYDVQLLKEQLLLFDRDSDMTNFIQTEKCLADNCIHQLSELSFCLMKLSRTLLANKKLNLSFSVRQENYTREQLDRIQSECMATLARVKEERRRIQACCICLERKSNTVILPCMHLVLCSNCCEPIRRCPICMQPISQMRQVYQ